MVQGKWFPMGSDLTLPVSLRHSVFGRGRDALDDQAWQVVVYQGDLPVGSARLWWEDGAFRLGDAGVLAAYRGQGFGDLLVRLLLFKALTHGAASVRLSAPAAVAPFFAKYGFQADGGGDPVAMSIRGQDVRLSHCGGNCEGCGHRTPECSPRALR